MAVRKVGLVTDSTACLPKPLVERYDFRIAPFSFVFGDAVYQDDENARPQDFYDLLRSHKEPPKTSPASPGAYLKLYQELSARYEAVLCITLHARLSSLYDTARVAVEMAKEKDPSCQIAVVDSGTASMAAGFVVLAAAEAACAGAGLPEVLKVVERMKPRVRLVAVLDTLEYLARSRRIPKVGAWAASLLNLKPILGITDGVVGRVGQATSKARALRKIERMIRQQMGPQGPDLSGQGRLHAAVIHTDAPDEAEAFRQRLATAFDCGELYLCPFTPVMGMYTGPGLVGVSYYVEEPGLRIAKGPS